MSYKALAISLFIALIVGFGIGYTFVPTKILTKTVVVENTVEHKNTTTTTTKKPDGTETTVVVDKGTVETDKSTSKLKETDRGNLNWMVSGFYTRNLDSQSEILISINRRVFGEVYVGIIGSNKGFGGVGLSLRF